MTPELAPSSPNSHTTPTRRRLKFSECLLRSYHEATKGLLAECPREESSSERSSELQNGPPGNKWLLASNLVIPNAGSEEGKRHSKNSGLERHESDEIMSRETTLSTIPVTDERQIKPLLLPESKSLFNEECVGGIFFTSSFFPP
ncbi:hypothetical protein TNCV_3570061 [Trichonephila clavipes]|nr:hypothetical protein TNCV_3570061 [Trichonephila clavipes]